KSRLQEASQERLGFTPVYRVLEEMGPDHNKKFRVGVFLGDDMIAEGVGMSKQEAQVEAAIRALDAKNWM
ncbi:MAG: putative dsRNA-binding protein, partial [bacterium]